MKKLWVGLLSFAMLFAGVLTLSNDFLLTHASENSAQKSAKEYSVSSCEDLVVALKSNDFNSATEYKSIKLTGDLKYETPARVAERGNFEIDVDGFVGLDGLVLDGNGYCITNLSLKSTSGTSYLALIPKATGATIKNLKLDGNLTFDISNLSDGGYVGGLIGYGTNVKIENCEMDLTNIYGVNYDEEGNVVENKNIVLNSNITFGVMAGELYGAQSYIHASTAYNNQMSVLLNEFSEVTIGGLVGTLNQGDVTNAISSCNISYSQTDDLTAVDGITQLVGGMVGKVTGQSAEVKNCLYGGVIDYASNATLKAGAIIGGGISFNKDNVRYDYYTQKLPSINPTGDGSIGSKENFQLLSNINEKYTTISKTVLQDEQLFEDALQAWKFDTVWDYQDDKIVLQKFRSYSFTIPEQFEIASEGEFLEEAKPNGTVTVKYDDPVTITVSPKDACKGWLNNLTVYKNGEPDTNAEIVENEGVWTVSLKANASTAGVYTFEAHQKTFHSTVEMSEADINDERGGIKIEGATASTTEPLNLTFTYLDKVETIQVEGNGVYCFEVWNLYTKTGETWELSNPSTSIKADTLKIVYGANQITYSDEEATLYITSGTTFKLEPTFNEDPACFKFKGDDKVLGVVFNGEDYDGQHAIKVSKEADSLLLKITIKSGYLLDVEAFARAFKALCQTGDNEYELPQNFQRKDPETDSSGNTTYFFSINVFSIENYTKMDIEGTERDAVELAMTTVKDANANNGAQAWVWIVVAIGVVAIGATVGIIFFLKRKGKGGKGGKGGKKASSQQAKKKSESYKDYFV